MQCSVLQNKDYEGQGDQERGNVEWILRAVKNSIFFCVQVSMMKVTPLSVVHLRGALEGEKFVVLIAGCFEPYRKTSVPAWRALLVVESSGIQAMCIFPSCHSDTCIHAQVDGCSILQLDSSLRWINCRGVHQNTQRTSTVFKIRQRYWIILVSVCCDCVLVHNH
jgi:hypothetical protein